MLKIRQANLVLFVIMVIFVIQVKQLSAVDMVTADSTAFEIADNATKIFGTYILEKGETLKENIRIIGGDVIIRGKVESGVQITVYGGDVFVEEGAEVLGQIICLGGKIINKSGKEISGSIIEANLGGLKLKRKTAKESEEKEETKDREQEQECKEKPPANSFEYSKYNNDVVFRYDPVDGVYFGVTWDWHLYDFPRMSLFLHTGYAFGSNDWRGGLLLEKYLGRKNQMTFYFSAFRDTKTKDDWIITPTENSLAAFLFHRNFYHFYESTGFYLGLTQRLFNFVKYDVHYRSEDQRSVQNSTNWSLFRSEEQFFDNPPIDDGLFASLTYTLQFGTLWDANSECGFNVSLSYEYSDTTFNSDFDFRKYLAELRFHFPMSAYTYLLGRVKVASAEKHLPLQEEFAMGGLGTVRGYPYYSFTAVNGGNRLFLFNLEFAIDQGGEDYIFLFFDAGNVWHQDEEMSFYQGFGRLTERLYSSAGIGLGEMDGFRIDLAKRLDRSDRKAWSLSVRIDRSF